MPKSTEVQGIGVYANLCLTIIAGCLLYLCYRTTTMDAHPSKVEIVGIDSRLNTPMPCKVMYKKKSNYSFGRTQWTDEGTLGVELVGGERRPERIQVEIVGVASSIENPLPIQMKQGQKRGLFGSTAPSDGAIAVRLVSIASNIEHPLPITAKKPAGGRFGVSSYDDAIAVRLVGIERPQGEGKWHAIPVRGPVGMLGEMGGIVGERPIEVKTGTWPLEVTVR